MITIKKKNIVNKKILSSKKVPIKIKNLLSKIGTVYQVKKDGKVVKEFQKEDKAIMFKNKLQKRW